MKKNKQYKMRICENDREFCQFVLQPAKNLCVCGLDKSKKCGYRGRDILLEPRKTKNKKKGK